MNKVLRVVVALPGVLFLVMGLRWVFDPSGAAAELGMPLLEGVGRSTQVGDLTSFFLALGSFILIGVITMQRTWLYAGAIILALAGTGRLLAWLLHDAALALDLIGPEFLIAGLLLFGASRIPAKG